MNSNYQGYKIYRATFLVFILSISSISALTIQEGPSITSPTVEIYLVPNTTIYEGDIVDCVITGDLTI